MGSWQGRVGLGTEEGGGGVGGVHVLRRPPKTGFKNSTHVENKLI